MRRVLHLGSPSGLYGAERWILALVRHLPPEQVESFVGVIKDDLSPDIPLCESADRIGVSTCVFESYGKLSLSAVGKLRRFIIERRIDIVHTHFYKTDIIGYLAARGTGCRIVSTPHGWSTRAGMALQLYEALDRLAFGLLHAVVPLSPELFSELKRLPWVRKRLHLVPNGVDLAEVDAVQIVSPEIAAFRRENDVLVGYVGQLIRRKGLDTLLRAFARVPLSNKRLIIVGEGPQRAELEALARALGVAERVHFLGFRPDRIGVLKGFDLFVLPSRLEGIPRCLLEAMAAKIPVVASDIPGSRELVIHDRTGLLFPVDDHEALAERIIQVGTNATLGVALATAAHDLVRREYSAEVMAARYAALYEQLATHGTGAPRMTGDLHVSE